MQLGAIGSVDGISRLVTVHPIGEDAKQQGTSVFVEIRWLGHALLVHDAEHPLAGTQIHASLEMPQEGMIMIALSERMQTHNHNTN